MRFLRFACLALVPALMPAQAPVAIRVDAGVTEGLMKPVWSYFGYDEPNYTYMRYGTKLIGELSASANAPVYIRAHHLLCTGDGTAALKWGSTNAYTEDAAGKPVYNWTILDRIFDTYVKAKAKPFVEIGFMPEALSVKPQPYATKWREKDSGTGWAYPPKDYGKWAELVYRWVRHSVERYGKDEVLTWYWELWNEPDIRYWLGTPAEYNRLYDYTAAAVKRALPGARVGGPATTDPAKPKAAAFLRQFLEHCATGENAATGKRGAPLDFITYHAKGRPDVVDGRVRMGLGRNLQNVAKGCEIVAAFPQFRNLPVILSEYDPEGCAACSARQYPQNAYRNGPLYPCYTAASIKNTLLLADRYKTNIEGMLTWAFEFEGQPYFDGFRTLATNGIDKPVLNVFRMAGLMRGDRVKVESSGAAGLDAILQGGVRTQPHIDALAAKSDRSITVMAWNYHDDDVPAPDAPVRLTVAGIPSAARRIMLRHYRIDRDHSNAYTAWKQMGAPQEPTPEQYAQLESAGQLQLLESPRWVSAEAGAVELDFRLPRQAVSLVELSW
jgi:xylan 1,4-beta-xylosidase